MASVGYLPDVPCLLLAGGWKGASGLGVSKVAFYRRELRSYQEFFEDMVLFVLFFLHKIVAVLFVYLLNPPKMGYPQKKTPI